MYRLILLYFFTLFIPLFSFAKECDCGDIAEDPLFAQAACKLEDALTKSLMFLGHDYPKVAQGIYHNGDKTKGPVNTYPYAGHIEWDITDETPWSEDEDDLIYVAAPSKIVRRKQWTDHPQDDLPYEHTEKQKFDLTESYTTLLQAFEVLHRDVCFLSKQDEVFLNDRLHDLAHEIDVYHMPGYRYCNMPKKNLLELQKQTQTNWARRLKVVEEKKAEAISFCTQSLDFCITNHGTCSAYMNRGLLYYLEGNNLRALNLLQQGLKKLNLEDAEKLLEKAKMLKGQTEIEAGLYADAVLTLTDLIQKNPKNRQAFFERAIAYFELGDFDLSLNDYLSSGIKEKPISLDMLGFAEGIRQGLLMGSVSGGLEYIPSLLSSLQGLGHGLWAFSQDPVQISEAFVEAVQNCFLFIKDHTLPEILLTLAPEVKVLIEQWDSLQDTSRGERIGEILGKYGVELLAGNGIAKAVKLCRNLKRANNLMTFEAMAISERNKAIIKLEAAKKAATRKEILKSSNLQIQLDKQGKHLVDHKNYIATDNKSILAHPNPQKLVNEFAGKGTKFTKLPPGVPGYQEIVNFEEFIGYAVNPKTGEKIATTWGKIHYAKDGVHIVPRSPK